METLYDILEVSRKASKEVIEKARASKALERHLEVKIEDNIYDELISKI